MQEAELILGEETVIEQDIPDPVPADQRSNDPDQVIVRQTFVELRVERVAQIYVRSEPHHPVIVDQSFDARVGQHLANDIANQHRF
ncbi:MAG: hypothetical protein U0L19_06370, partial [Bacteroidales bacterium]|nr:hypothetical protein [Bacteroidales bacterium]